MKLSSALFSGSLITLSLTGLIVFAGNPADSGWEQSIFAGLFATVFCSVMAVITESSGN